MIKPEPITVDGRDGVVVFMNADGQPVDPQSPDAVVAKAVFDDGGRSMYSVGPKKTDLRAIHLYGTTAGQIKGWETRHAGGEGAKDEETRDELSTTEAPPPKPMTRDELAAETAEGGRFDTALKRTTESLKATVRLEQVLGKGKPVMIARETPQLIRTAELTATVLEEMKAQGLTMPDMVTIDTQTRDKQTGPSGQVRSKSVAEWDGRRRRHNHMIIAVPATVPDDMPLDDVAAVTFSAQSERWLPKDFDDDTRTTYDRFTIRAMRDVIVHEMGHVQDHMKANAGVIAGSTAKIKEGPDKGKYTPKAKAIQRAALRVSTYALKNRNEFIAESFTRMMRGETLAPDSMALYKKLKGPQVPKS